MSGSSRLSEICFPDLDGWIRVLGAPSLEKLQQKAERAAKNGMPYEALLYGLETSESTPDEEWQDPIGSTQRAKKILDAYGKQLVMAPGLRLMSQNEDKYAAMAALSDIWILQTQQLQKNGPGLAYRQEVKRIVDLIKAGNPDVPIWAQITLPPDRDPNAEEWLTFHQSIADLVDGTYIGVYTWKSADPDQLKATIDAIFSALCESEQ
jgi:hypothetical protein